MVGLLQVSGSVAVVVELCLKETSRTLIKEDSKQFRHSCKNSLVIGGAFY